MIVKVRIWNNGFYFTLRPDAATPLLGMRATTVREGPDIDETKVRVLRPIMHLFVSLFDDVFARHSSTPSSPSLTSPRWYHSQHSGTEAMDRLGAKCLRLAGGIALADFHCSRYRIPRHFFPERHEAWRLHNAAFPGDASFLWRVG